jgi:two-component system CheB/CheR fusion protein
MERARLSTVLGHMLDGVVVVGPDGEELFTNRAYEAMFDGVDISHDAVDANGRPLSPSRSPVKLAAAGQSVSQEFSIAGPNGQRRWLEATGGPLADGGVRGGVIVIRDITDRRLRRTQEEFIAVAGHELRTPLAALRGYLQLLGRTPEVESSEVARRHAASALVQANRLARLTSELLDASRLEHGRLQLDRAPIDIVPVIQRAVEVGQIVSQDQPIHLVGPREPLIVNADEVRLEQAVLNVITNAQQHASESPTIDVAIRGNSKKATITVTDYGPGIDEDGRAHTFERFSKLADRSRNPTAGLGLGLYITKAIVEAHGGRVLLDSKRGDGTRVTISLPLAAEQTDGARRRLQDVTIGEAPSPARAAGNATGRRAPRSVGKPGKS